MMFYNIYVKLGNLLEFALFLAMTARNDAASYEVL